MRRSRGAPEQRHHVFDMRSIATTPSSHAVGSGSRLPTFVMLGQAKRDPGIHAMPVRLDAGGAEYGRAEHCRIRGSRSASRRLAVDDEKGRRRSAFHV